MERELKMTDNNVVCLKCGKQFFFVLSDGAEIPDTACPDCGGKDIGKLTKSSLFKNYGIYTGGG